MARTTSGNYDALAWVQDEVQQSLADTLQALTRFIDSPADDNALALCITQIHQINGTMEMLNLQGAQLLASEMLASAIALQDKTIPEILPAQDSLLKSTLLLPNYLKLVGTSLPDHPLRLIETINELRHARGVSILEEQDLFKTSLLIQLPDEVSPDPYQNTPKIGIPANKLSHVFQISLLNWFKTNDLASLQRMAKIVHFIRLSCIQERTIILWWAAEGIIEAILDNGISATPDTKIKIGTLNQSIKLFSNQDEKQFLSVFPEELVYSLLLQIAHSTSNGRYVNSLKKAFNLDFFNKQQHQKIYSYSGNALFEVNAELLVQLQEIKEHADRLALSDHYSADITTTLVEQFSSMSSTLLLLEEHIVSSLLHDQAKQFQELANQQLSPSDDQLMALANELLHIEKLLQVENQNTATDSNSHIQLQQTVITECQHELITVKETLSLLVEHPEFSSQSLSDIASQLHLIAGSLSMLNLDEAVSLFENTIRQIEKTKLEQHAITSNELDLFAEIIAAVDLYMDNLRHSGSEKSQLLQAAQNTLDNFEHTKLTNAHADELTFAITRDVDLTPPQAETRVQRYIVRQAELVDSTAKISLATISPLATSVQRYIDQQVELVDNIAEISLATISPLATSVQRYIDQQVALIDNTAEISLATISPLATSVQRYIDQPAELIDSTAEISLATISPLATSVQRYIDQQVELVDSIAEISLATISPLATSVQRYIDQQVELVNSTAEISLITTYPLETSVQRYIDQQAELIDLTPTLVLTAQFSDGIDTDIADIFIEEANEVLAKLQQLLPKWDAQSNTEVLAIIRRHFHTLKGSGYMAGANVIADLAKAVDYLLNKMLEGQLEISAQLTPLISDCIQLIPDLLCHFTNGEMAANDRATELTQTATRLLETENNLSEDDELQQIFNLEATQYIVTFKQALNESTANFTINKELLRAAHSLKGCANIAQVMPVAEVATQLDKSLRERYELGATTLNEQQRDVLTSAIKGLFHYIESIKTPQTNPKPDISSFNDTLQQLLPTDDEKAAQQKLIDPEFLAVFIEESDELLSQYEQQINQFKQHATNPDIKTTLKQILTTLRDNAAMLKLSTLSELYQLLIELTEHVNGGDNDHLRLFELGSEEINLQIESLLQDKPNPSISDFKQKLENSLSQAPQYQVEPIVISNAFFTVPNEDPDLLEAFTEECAELLASSGKAIKHWQKEPRAQDAVLQLQRDLHTMKGGARLAGITPIADLTHQIESLVLQITETEAKIEASPAFFDLLQRSQDRLADMQELLADQSGFNFADDLVNEIASFSNPSLAISAQKTSTPVDSSNTQHHNHNDQIRVRADLLDFLSNFAGEVNISRDRVGQQNSAIKQQLAEMESTLSRLQEQLRNLEIETETQILVRYDDELLKRESEFDPLELDRFSMFQHLSRGLTESVSDMHEISQSLELLVQESDGILLQQSRLSNDLQQGLMNTRLIPFGGLVPRFERIVRQTNVELGKQSQLIIHGAERELDRTIIDRIVAPIEHLLRNAIAHGIESADQRRALGKNTIGTLTITVIREGSEILLSLSDDGQGINIEKVRQKALAQKLIDPNNMPSDEDLIQLILSSGFSTADNVSQLAGRGVGMDVVINEVRTLKGRLSIQSISGKSTTFNIRLPLTLSIMQALLVSTYDHQYAIPLATVHAGDRIAVSTVKKLLQQQGDSDYEVNGNHYRLLPLSTLLDLPLILPDDPKIQLPLLLFHYGDMHIALLVDAINSNREIVLKSVGEQLGHIAAITGATILGDGQVVFILDIPTLVETIDIQNANHKTKLDSSELLTVAKVTPPEHTPLAMVVDDSITMRKASSNLLKRHGFDVMTARDGLDGVAQLNEQIPDIILLDVEMPRMDGFEFAVLIRNTEHYKHIPIIMITSRTGAKHRDRGMDIGVNAYMGKPYQELELVETMKKLLGTRYPHLDH
ncbi:MAG: chemosensory pili system protein ChpA (sensor histidine kinase/response regulator) [Methylophagaceae bacterium]|jgi:chemosensory pili system protein ChpA (sensor histidine kinase/response regulator)